MITKTVKMLAISNRKLRNSTEHFFPLRGFFFVPLVFACLLVLPTARAVSPPPDGCYPNYTTAEGCNALQNLVGGFGNTALGWYALFSEVNGSYNTAVGGGALALNTDDSNTAVGAAALLLNTAGGANTAVGADALALNEDGGGNTATGYFALMSNIDGASNTAVGRVALTSHQTGDFNTAIGNQAMQDHTSGIGNVAVGSIALSNVTTGDNNVGLGRGAYANTTGNENIGVGHNAGYNMTLGSNNICIGSPGDATAFSVSDRCFIGNIRGVTVGNGDGVNVIVDSDGQLGTINSSRRFKENIKPMDQSSEAILSLKPVTFHYKKRDTKKGSNTPQFGLIAEDVQRVDPDLVVYGEDGKPLSVRYNAVNVMLLNEFLKEHQKVEAQQKNITEQNVKIANQTAMITQQQKGMALLTAQLKEQAIQIQKVSARLEMHRPTGKIVVNEP